MEQESAVSEGFFLEGLDSMLLRDSFVGPSQCFFLVNDAQSLNPVEFAYLPNDTEDKSSLAVHDVNSSDSYNLGLQLILADIHHVVTILYDVDPAA